MSEPLPAHVRDQLRELEEVRAFLRSDVAQKLSAEELRSKTMDIRLKIHRERRLRDLAKEEAAEMHLFALSPEADKLSPSALEERQREIQKRLRNERHERSKKASARYTASAAARIKAFLKTPEAQYLSADELFLKKLEVGSEADEEQSRALAQKVQAFKDSTEARLMSSDQIQARVMEIKWACREPLSVTEEEIARFHPAPKKRALPIRALKAVADLPRVVRCFYRQIIRWQDFESEEERAAREEEKLDELVDDYLNELQYMSAEDDSSPHTKPELEKYLERFDLKKESLG